MEPLRRARALVTASLASDLDRLRALLSAVDDVEACFEPGLAAALAWQAQEFEKRTSIYCTVRAEANDKALGRDVSTALFRIFQEALTNVARHAKAKHVDVHLFEQEGSLVFTVRDDGRGIRTGDVHDPRSLGLLGMRERARRLGGTVSFSPVAPHGTLVEVRLPL